MLRNHLVLHRGPVLRSLVVALLDRATERVVVFDSELRTTTSLEIGWMLVLCVMRFKAKKKEEKWR
jgi:hypothetical protein